MRVRRRTHPSSASLQQRYPCLTRFLLLCVVCVFYGINRYYSLLQRQRLDDAALTLRGARARQAARVDLHQAAHAATHLIVVAGHSVAAPSRHPQDADRDERDWYLLDYQRHRGLPQAMVAHIRAGLAAAASDPRSLLVFSGGQTRAAVGPESEGASYFRVAETMDLWPAPAAPGLEDAAAADGIAAPAEERPADSVRARTTTEEFATDSFTNLLYSICRFREVTGHYPRDITMVSFTFKRERFQTLHAPALRWPADRFHYVGVDPPPETGFDLAEAARGEREQAAAPFAADPYGCHSPVLQLKRRARNPFARTPPYELSCPELRELLNYCGTELIAADKVPWATTG